MPDVKLKEMLDWKWGLGDMDFAFGACVCFACGIRKPSAKPGLDWLACEDKVACCCFKMAVDQT